MTDEFIREVDEEYRRDQIAKIWSRYGAVFVALAVVLVAGVGGWRYWEHLQLQQAELNAIRFEDAVQLSRESKRDESEAALSTLMGDAPAGYRLLARFRLAAERGQGSPEAGAKAFDTIAADTDVEATMRDLARLRAASLRLGTAEAAAAEEGLQQMVVPANPWRHAAREFLGLSALKRGDLDAAGKWFDQIASDRETPQSLRGRLEIYTALVAGGAVPTTQ